MKIHLRFVLAVFRGTTVPCSLRRTATKDGREGQAESSQALETLCERIRAETLLSSIWVFPKIGVPQNG